MKVIRQFLAWVKKWLWTKPVSKPAPPTAVEALPYYICVKYHDQWVNLRKSEVPLWNQMSRKDRRGMAQRFASLEKKGYIRFDEINGKMTCIKNKNYERKADIRQSSDDKNGSGE